MALYGYSFNLPEGMSAEQKNKLEALALTTARKASVTDTGRFRKGWRAKVKGDTLIVDSRVPYAVYVEKGLGYNKHNKYKVRDALNRIGFESMFDKEIGDLVIPAAIAGTVAATTAGGSTKPSQEAPSSPNTAQTTKPNTLITSEDLIGLNASEIKDLIRQRTSTTNINAIPQLQKPIPTGSFFNTSSLLVLIAAAVAANELTKEEEDGKDSNQEE